MITTIIIDDEKNSIETLKKDLSSYGDISVVDTCISVSKAKKAVLNYRPSLLFLDVEMPHLSGFEFLNEIQDEIDWEMDIVFYSAFDKYILEALRSSATDFLLKPYLLEELDEVVDRIRKRKCAKQSDINKVLSTIKKLSKRIAIQTIFGISLLNKEDVLFFNRNENLWHANLTNGDVLTLRQGVTLSDISKLCPTFFMINPQQIVNINHIAYIENKTFRCFFHPPYEDYGKDLFISRRNFTKLKNQLEIL